ncbi:MAG: aldo/keto reductase, partial [Candidatus Sulfotelmatobacter sp.]
LHAPSSTKNREQQRDPEMHQTRKGKQWYFGMKAHVGVDSKTKYGWAKYVGHQVYYSLVGRDYEYELMPLALDQNVGALVWSPLGWARLTGKIRRGQPLPQVSRLPKTADGGPPVPDDYLHRVVDAIDAVAQETGKTVAQIALNWLLRKPTVSTLVIGARNEEQLMQNIGAEGWRLTPVQVAKLDEASKSAVPYPYWHQRQSQDRSPVPPSVGQ